MFMYTKPVHKGDDLTTFIVPKVERIRSLNLPEPLGPPWPVVGHLYCMNAVYALGTEDIDHFRL